MHKTGCSLRLGNLVDEVAGGQRIAYLVSLVYMEEFDETFERRVMNLLRQLGSNEPPIKVPSVAECTFCHITANDCPERVAVALENRQVELGDF